MGGSLRRMDHCCRRALEVSYCEVGNYWPEAGDSYSLVVLDTKMLFRDRYKIGQRRPRRQKSHGDFFLSWTAASRGHGQYVLDQKITFSIKLANPLVYFQVFKFVGHQTPTTASSRSPTAHRKSTLRFCHSISGNT